MRDSLTFYLANCDDGSSPEVVASEIELYSNFLDSLEIDERESSSFRSRIGVEVVEKINELLLQGDYVTCSLDFHGGNALESERELLENQILGTRLLLYPAMTINIWRGVDQVSELLGILAKIATHPDLVDYQSRLGDAVRLVASAISNQNSGQDIVVIGILKCPQ